MPPSAQPPPLLEPYLSLSSPSSLILLTSVLGASTNWLVLQFLHAALSLSSKTNSERDVATGHRQEKNKVVLFSFLRDWDFWVEGGRKMGLNLAQLTEKGDLVFVDGLSNLSGVTGTSKKETGRTMLKDMNLRSVEQIILAAVESTKEAEAGSGNVVLILDGLDFLLAATNTDAGALLDTVAELREHLHTTLITMSVDSPLVQSTATPLEINHTALVTSLAHQSHLVISLRLLDTGIAKDISGVIRITKGPESSDQLEEKEVLYFVAGDGAVKVFPRGA